MKKKMLIALLVLAIIIAFLFINEARNTYSYDGPMKLATEYPPPGEAAETKSIIGSLQTILKKDYVDKNKRVMRDAHPKQHGLVKAEFTVLDDIPNELKVGVFKEAKSYHSWIRYSNLNAGGKDISADSRGMAIKLMGVEGLKILPDLRDATTHDFVFMSTQTFVTKDIKGFADLLTSINNGKVVMHMLTHPRLLYLFLKVRIKVASLLDIEWGSTTPYQYGDIAVKYAVLPQDPTGQTLPGKDASPDFLKERMAATLSKGDILLDFYIQKQVDASKMPIEDPRVLWSRDLSPFIKVATVKVLQQKFDSPEQELYGDQLSFTPWHALPVHRPLGGINRGRKAIYDTMSKFRHSHNDEVSVEPKDWKSF